MNKIVIKHYHSPVGELLIGSFEGRLCLCDWVDGKKRSRNESRMKAALKAGFEEGSSEVIEKAVEELNEYFTGKRKDFDIPVHFTGSQFQNRVWTELQKIPYGSTVSYGEIARRIGRPKSVRAVANANAANPISILVPCHRVIGSDGSLTGYGGGLDAKEKLLKIEKVVI
jgi:methylated-DNA-[protein]-cysteine S-methyltransferase